MKKIFTSPIFWLVVFFMILFREFIFLGKVPLPIDTLVGAYFPWLDYKWGYAVGVPVKNPLASDAFSTFFVWKKLTGELLLDGILPLWNKYSLSGYPLLATFHSAVLFPANILFLLPINLGWGIYILLAPIAAASAMYLFLQNKVKSISGLFVGSILYATAGLMTTWAQYGTAVWAAALLPLILWCLDSIVATNRPRYFLYLTLSIALLVFAGHVQLLTYSFFIALVYFLVELWSSRKLTPTLVGNIFLAALLGVGLGAIQLFPTFEYYQRSIRAEESFVSFFNYGLSNWFQAIRLWAADFFGNPVTGNHFSKVDYSEFSSYLGVLSLPLVFSYLFSKNKKRFTFFIYLFFVSLLLAFDSPVSKLIFSLPIPLLTYSSASRLFFLTNLSAAVLVAASIDNLGNDKKSVNKSLIFSFLFLALTLAAPLLIDPLHRPVSFRNALFYSSILAFFVGACLILRKKIQLLAVLTALIFSFDLGRYYLKYNTFVSSHLVFPNTPVVDFLQGINSPYRFAKENTNIFPSNSWIAYGLESTEGYDPLTPSNYAHYFNKINNGLYRNRVSRVLNLEHYNRKFLNASNVRYVLAKSETFKTQLALDGFKPVFNDKSITIFENPGAKERAFFIPKLEFAKDGESAIDVVDKPDFDPTREAAIVASPFDIGSDGEVVSINHRDNWVEIKTNNKSKSFLVLSDIYDPGWKSYINGNETKVYEVNGAMRGVVVPAGEATVLFRYEPKSFRAGLIVSLGSALILIVWQIALHLKSKK